MSRTTRTLLALALIFGPTLAIPTLARAQEVPVEGEEDEGDPLMGYMGTGALACAALFILCKTARR